MASVRKYVTAAKRGETCKPMQSAGNKESDAKCRKNAIDAEREKNVNRCHGRENATIGKCGKHCNRLQARQHESDETGAKSKVPNIIVNRGNWLGSPANIKGTNKDTKIYVERSTTLHNLLFSPHTLCMNHVTNTFLLVSSSVRSKQLLCFVQGQGQKTEQ